MDTTAVTTGAGDVTVAAGGTVCTVAVVGAALAWTVALTVTDLRELRLPDRLTLPAVPLSWLLAGFLTGPAGLLRGLAGAVAWWAVCVLPGRISHRLRTGGGDAKLALSLGAVTAASGGAGGWGAAVAGASVVTLVLAVGRSRHRRRPTVVPHGPGMLVASWISVLLTM